MNKLLVVFIVCFVISMGSGVSIAATNSNVVFTSEEQQWIKNHPIIKVGGEVDWAPFDYVNQYGDYDGLVNEFLKLIEKKTGLKLDVETGYTWAELISKFKNNDYDLLPAVYYSNERTEYGLYTQPYLQVKEFVYIRDDNKTINSFYDLADKIIAMPKGYTQIGKLKEILPNVTIIETTNLLGAISAVLNNKADALIEGQAVMNFTLKQNMITGLRGIMQEAFAPKELHMLVSKDKPLLKKIIQKALNVISKQERNQILNEYMGFTGETYNERIVNLSADEYRYLKKKKTIKMCVDPDWLPFERITEQKKHEGMTANYMQLFSSWIGVPIQLVKTDNWQQSLAFGKSRQCDILSAAAKTPEREKYWSFTSPYIVFPNVIATLNTKNFIKDIKDELDKPFGVVKGFAVIEILKRKYPEIKLIEVESVSDGLKKVSIGELFGFIDTIASIGYTMHSENFLHLKIAGEVGAELKLAIAVRKDEQQLLSVLNKAISHLTREDKNEVDSQWISITFDKEFDYTLLWQVLALAFIIILIIIFWVRKLSLAKQQIQQLNDELHVAGDRLNFALEGSNDGLWDWNIVEGKVFLSSRFEQMLGYQEGELDCSVPDLKNMISKPFHERVIEALELHLSNKVAFYNAQYKMQTKDGGWLWVESKGKVVKRDENGRALRMVGVHSDISERKQLEKELSQQLKLVEEKESFLNELIDSQDQLIVVTDGEKIVNVNKAFLDFFEVEALENFLSKNNCISDLFIEGPNKEYLQKEQDGTLWVQFVVETVDVTHKVLMEKDWTDYVFTVSGAQVGGGLYIAVFSDITEMENAKNNAEKGLLFTEQLIDGVPAAFYYQDKNLMFQKVNSAFCKLVDKPSEEIIFFGMLDMWEESIAQAYYQSDLMLKDQKLAGDTVELSLLDASDSELNFIIYKTVVYDKDNAFDGIIGLMMDVTPLKVIERELETSKKMMSDSIEYSSLIQHAIVPDFEVFREYFDEYFTIWHPRDVVGGDIYFFEQLRHKDECLLMVIDCTGHGVPGAFVTMLVKAVERQIVNDIMLSKEPVSPAKVLSIFNRSIKNLLRQEDEDAISNAGFDGGVLYIDYRDNIVRYAGAQMPLFIVQEGKLTVLKGDRHSIGYKSSDINYQFKDHTLSIGKETRLYLTTDGFLDQNGGLKGLRFGKKRFMKLIEENYQESFADQQELFLYEAQKYRGNEAKNDDVTAIGIKLRTAEAVR